MFDNIYTLLLTGANKHLPKELARVGGGAISRYGVIIRDTMVLYVCM